MSTYVVTGAASGIGRATSAELIGQGHRVIGVDRAASDVDADLSTAEGRAAAVSQINEITPAGVAGFVPCAGLGGFTGVDSALLVSVNYFGAIDLLRSLRPLLVQAAENDEPTAVVLLSSNSVTCQPGWPRDVALACLDGDEQAARKAAGKHEAVHVYPATKAALAWWARREGLTKDWIGSGIRVNAIAPGLVDTAMTEQLRADPDLGVFADAYPTAIGRPGQPEEIASAIAFLLSGRASLIVGATLFADGGTDAIMHPMRPDPI
ncbi:MAG TPA: SDR family oxidoreductase [Nocardioidaceae bacterium]|nr:SDR family oxidoreductase [Nocardioidaceae bacterium]